LALFYYLVDCKAKDLKLSMDNALTNW